MLRCDTQDALALAQITLFIKNDEVCSAHKYVVVSDPVRSRGLNGSVQHPKPSLNPRRTRAFFRNTNRRLTQD